MAHKSYDVSTSYRAATPRRNRTRGTETNAVGSVISVVGGGASLDLSAKLDKSVFDDLFEKVNIGTAAVPKYAIRAKYGLYTDDFLTGRGRPASISGGGGGGASALSDLNDVQLSASLAAGDLLQYDGTHWVNIPQNSLKPDLSGYATQEWVESRGYALASALAAHAGDTSIHVSTSDRAKWNKAASDLSAILGSDSDKIINKWEEVVAFLDTYTEADTLANLLSNKADKAISIKAGAGLAGGGTLAADRTLSLAVSGVTAGTYAKITVDIYGRATSGASLSASDIPALSISKITGLQTALDTKLSADVFDDLFEKVNIGTADTPKYAIRAKYGIYTDEFLTGRGRTASIPGGGDGQSYDRLDSWSDYSTDKEGYVLSAKLGYDLYADVNSLKSGAAVSVTTAGSGNAITDISKSGTVITVTKGATFLTKSEADSEFVKSLGTSGNYLTWVKNGATNNITVPFATMASVLNSNGRLTAVTNTKHGAGLRMYEVYNNGYPTVYGNLIAVQGGSSSGQGELLLGWSGSDSGHANIYYRSQRDNVSAFSAWATIIDSVNYATTLDSRYYTKSEVDAKNYIKDRTNGTTTYLNFGAAGIYTTAWLAAWSGYELRAMSPANVLACINAVSKAGDTMTGILRVNQINSTEDSGLLGYKILSATTWFVGSDNEQGIVRSDNSSLLHRRSGTDYTIWDAGNDGAGSGLDADTLDGIQASSFFHYQGMVPSGYVFLTDYNAGAADYANYNSGVYKHNRSGYSDMLIHFQGEGSTSGLELYTSYTDNSNLQYRKTIDNNRISGPWRTIVTELNIGSYNAGSATRLNAVRTIWGQPFDGTANVSGNMTGVGSIDASGPIHSTVGLWTEGYLAGRGQASESDTRLKRHIQDVSFTVTQIADAPLWRFAWRRDGIVDVGSVAQYWRGVMPELTNMLPDGVHLGLDYGKTALMASVSLARAHRRLEERVAVLERENKRLKKELNRLKAA